MLSRNTRGPAILLALITSLAAAGVVVAADAAVAAGGAAEPVPAAVAASSTSTSTSTASARSDAPSSTPPPTPTKRPSAASSGSTRSSSASPSSKPAPRASASGGRLSGTAELAKGANQAVAAGEVAQGVVYFLPRNGGRRPVPARFSVDTLSKGFSPSLSVVPVGSTISFPNRDQILHNVFSKTPGSTFDVGFFGPGESREAQFNKPGLVVVNCSVHNSMRSNVLVLSTPYYTRPGRDGRFTLEGVPPGPGTLVFWHPRANAQSVAVAGGVNEPVVFRLAAIRASLDAHRR